MLDEDVRVVAPDDFVKLISKNLGVFLYQNHPNPFNDRTTFSFKLSFAQNVTLNILESSGDLLKTIYDGAAEAGVTKVDFFKESSMAPGVYMCRLTTPYQTRMISFQIY
jgi:hypothetical protein